MRNLRSVFVYSVILPLYAVAPFSADAQTTERMSVDSDGNPGNDGSERRPTVGYLMVLVDSFDLAKGADRVLRRMLRNIRYALEVGNAGRTQVAANKLGAFIDYVESQRDKYLTDEQAHELIATAEDIQKGLQSSGTG